ncbi:hypothetical protein PACTADRAFT_51089 [Pachysolen tannophilus NRRL Y-2460]|uniref:Cap-associated protein CAF20 n=1 Tax=Pachysolen tannophilus NRRL Y-2460 TaxID=669874 RepID=A0A1E4TR61_PACTA|nr:hypothetical protein PACTADRAFT_51089 [Pachysolen tannophilus NRRL Y-2460]
MMVRYTEEELLKYKDAGSLPQGADLSGFVKMVEDVKVALAAVCENDENHFPNGRRRSSANHHRPIFRKNKHKEFLPRPDADGWITTAKTKKSFGSAEGEVSRDVFRESVKDSFVKAKPNNKNIGSSKPADPRDVIADKNTVTFNAFDALVDDEDDNEEGDEE